MAPVVALQDNGSKLSPSRQSSVAAAICRHIATFDVDDDREVALALRRQGPPAYERLASFRRGHPPPAPRLAARQAIYIMLVGVLANESFATRFGEPRSATRAGLRSRLRSRSDRFEHDVAPPLVDLSG
jgi:hypothetical protein